MSVVRPGRYTFFNMPDISDTYAVLEIVEYLGGIVEYGQDAWHVDTRPVRSDPVPRSLTARSTGTFQFLGALLGRYGAASVAAPGGDRIGGRPVDLHLTALRALGAETTVFDDMYSASADSLTGTEYEFEIPSAGALINFLVAAVRADGPTHVSNFPWDRDISAACDFLTLMGASIQRSPNSARMVVEPFPSPDVEIEVEYRVPPDRNDTATWMIAGAISRDGVRLEQADTDDVVPLVRLLQELGVAVRGVDSETVTVSPPQAMVADDLHIEAGPSPRLHSDWAQMLSVLCLTCDGRSRILDLMYEQRYGQVKDLRRMGGDIKVVPYPVDAGALMYDRAANVAEALEISGPSDLRAADASGGDVRGAMALTLAAAIAHGTSSIADADQLARGYENLLERLAAVGVTAWVEAAH
jgi:UDP-N-acetylglucosamine 1-carboxyvinyltransferase